MAAPGAELPRDPHIVQRDPGLAAERTEAAWSRSGLALVVCIAAIMKRVPAMQVAHRWAILVAIPAVVALVVVMTVRSQRRAAPGMPTIDVTAQRLQRVAWNVAGVGVLCFAVLALGLI